MQFFFIRNARNRGDEYDHLISWGNSRGFLLLFWGGDFPLPRHLLGWGQLLLAVIRGLTWHGIVDREAAISAGTLLDWIGCAVFIEGPGRSACGYFPRETEAETETETDRRSQSHVALPHTTCIPMCLITSTCTYVCIYIYIVILKWRGWWYIAVWDGIVMRVHYRYRFDALFSLERSLEWVSRAMWVAKIRCWAG